MNTNLRHPLHDIDERYRLVRSILDPVGELALNYFHQLGSLSVQEKLNGQDVVTKADKEVEHFLKKAILQTFPEDNILGEESGLSEGKNDFIWVIDPIDGTSCFVHNLRSWCISIALTYQGKVVLGVVYDVANNECFEALEGQGAYVNQQRIHVDDKQSIQQGFIGLGANLRVGPDVSARFAGHLLSQKGMFYRNGSCALMMSYVACGRLLGYYEPHVNSWDCFAGLLLIQEAGGWVSDFSGKDKLLHGSAISAGAPQIKQALTQLITLAQQP